AATRHGGARGRSARGGAGGGAAAEAAEARSRAAGADAAPAGERARSGGRSGRSAAAPAGPRAQGGDRERQARACAREAGGAAASRRRTGGADALGGITPTRHRSPKRAVSLTSWALDFQIPDGGGKVDGVCSRTMERSWRGNPHFGDVSDPVMPRYRSDIPRSTTGALESHLCANRRPLIKRMAAEWRTQLPLDRTFDDKCRHPK